MYHHDPSVQFQKYEQRASLLPTPEDQRDRLELSLAIKNFLESQAPSLIVPISLYLHSVEINFHKDFFFLVFVFFLGIKIWNFIVTEQTILKLFCFNRIGSSLLNRYIPNWYFFPVLELGELVAAWMCPFAKNKGFLGSKRPGEIKNRDKQFGWDLGGPKYALFCPRRCNGTRRSAGRVLFSLSRRTLYISQACPLGNLILADKLSRRYLDNSFSSIL